MNSTRPTAKTENSGISKETRQDAPGRQALPAALTDRPVTVDRLDRVVQPSTDDILYEADPANHRVVARYGGSGDVAFAFGRQGRGPGQFESPLHVTTVWPEFSGEPAPGEAANIFTPWLAVADYGNRRIQFFECDGAFIGEIELEQDQPPCHLTWRAPALEVTTVEGRALRIHVAAALLTSTRRDTRHESARTSDPRRTWRVC